MDVNKIMENLFMAFRTSVVSLVLITCVITFAQPSQAKSTEKADIDFTHHVGATLVFPFFQTGDWDSIDTNEIDYDLPVGVRVAYERDIIYGRHFILVQTALEWDIAQAEDDRSYASFWSIRSVVTAGYGYRLAGGLALAVQVGAGFGLWQYEFLLSSEKEHGAAGLVYATYLPIECDAKIRYQFNNGWTIGLFGGYHFSDVRLSRERRCTEDELSLNDPSSNHFRVGLEVGFSIPVKRSRTNQ